MRKSRFENSARHLKWQSNKKAGAVGAGPFSYAMRLFFIIVFMRIFTLAARRLLGGATLLITLHAFGAFARIAADLAGEMDKVDEFIGLTA
jgi:hypothetical protein